MLLNRRHLSNIFAVKLSECALNPANSNAGNMRRTGIGFFAVEQQIDQPVRQFDVRRSVKQHDHSSHKSIPHNDFAEIVTNCDWLQDDSSSKVLNRKAFFDVFIQFSASTRISRGVA